ncbi:outer dense fiber protein 3 [Diachasma alloeum]|uniref:outer dense fiber protein 3 n=1 Tax=Diachasma alloeum TaxID=454923 RepID=UPI000738269E|nr:outer dense fiber protein 3 [Diachasma alloeum]
MSQRSQTKASKKRNKANPEESNTAKKSGAICSFQGPGPRYKLKPLVGYDDHCFSKYRNPAFSILGKSLKGYIAADGPGPKYRPEFPPAQGFSLGMLLKGKKYECTPGPYNIPPYTPTPAFSIKWRTKARGGLVSAGPYYIPRDLNGPAFTMGARLPSGRNDCGPGPGLIKVDMVKPRAPAFSLRARPADRIKCASPGPYDPVNLDKAPAFSFGVKHSPCAPPLITKCDQVC